ncbi:MAG: hypothetical protein ACPGYV_02880 [Phycisphaeraceae bacterium]
MDLQDIRYWFEDLDLRNKSEEYKPFIILGLCLVIVFCLSLVLCQLTGGGSGSFSNEVRLVYYDTTNQIIKLVDHEYPAIPQSPLEGTTDIFLASVYGCEDCPQGTIKDGMTRAELKDKGMFIGWLERIDPTANDEMMLYEQGYEYRLVEGATWYNATDPGYQKIIEDLYNRCPNARPCLP